MNHFTYLLRKHLLLFGTVSGLVLWALFASLFALSREDKVILIGIDSNGTRIIESHDDPLFKTEVVNFTRRFFSLLYNFDADLFSENVGRASDLMSKALWEEQKAKIVKLEAMVKAEKIVHSGVVKSITKLKDGRFQVIVRTSQQHRMKSIDQDLVVTMAIRPIERSTQNPWGMEVETLEESKLN